MFVADDTVIDDGWATGFVTSGGPKIEIGVAFFDSTSTRLSSNAFFVNEDLVGWDSATFSITHVDALGTPTNLASGTMLTVVPEPTSAGMLALGLVALGARRPRRS